MHLIVGLGNPGESYEKTRHNAGFMALDKIRESFEFPEFTANKKVHGLVSKGKIGRSVAVLLKPETFMNDSGVSVQAAMTFYKVTPENLIVVHDDKDIPIGQTKVQSGRGDAGHNGVKSIIEHLGTKDFNRLRIGIEPGDEIILDTADFVLRRFSSDETKILNKVFLNVIKEVEEKV
jgi:PTH1 family peptidyl-tRNA hydrolase